VSVSAARAERVRWADTAKGLCILLVVLWHVVAKQYLRLEWPEGLRVPGVWGTLCELLLPLRMPLFFTISGMFALGAVHRPWRISARSRVAKFLYLYVVWLLIHTALLSLAPDFPTDRATSPLGLLEQLTITPSNLWYLYALALYFVIAKVTWRLPRVVMLCAAFALSVAAASELVPVPGNRAGLLQNLVFFLLGLYFRRHVERLAEGVNWARFALTTGVYGGLLVVMVVTGTQDVPGVWPVVCVAAAAFGVVGSAMLARWDRIATPLISIGRRTLPIYVIHMPLLALLDLALARPLSALAKTPFGLPLAILEPILMTALIAWVCLTLHRGLEAARLSRFLLDLPGGSKPAEARPAATPAATPEPVATPAGVGAHHTAPHSGTFAGAARPTGSSPAAQAATWPTVTEQAAAPLPIRRRPAQNGAARYPDPAAGHRSSPQSHGSSPQSHRQGAHTGHTPQVPPAQRAYPQPGHPASPPTSGYQNPDAQATLPYEAYLSAYPPAGRHPGAPAAQPYPAQHGPSNPAAPQTGPAATGHRVRPSSAGSHEAPSQPSSGRWFDHPQTAPGTSWAPGTADGYAAETTALGHQDPSEAEWPWSRDPDRTLPMRPSHRPNDPRS